LEIALMFLLPIVALLLLYIYRHRILRAAGRPLVSSDEPREPHDVIVLLNGNLSTRPYLAAATYRKRSTPILIARLADTEEVRLGVIPNVSDATKTLLERLGVQGKDILLLRGEGWVAGTWNEAILHLAYVREAGFTRVLVVTDAFHTRRALWTFRRLLRDEPISVCCAATPYSLNLVDRWWQSQYGLIQVVVEYLKFFHYWRSRNVFPTSLTAMPSAREVRSIVHGE
jgi:uncharacterized SAM-binding protein YcdF (DUF218 family)